jgi:hypothetical protein
VKVVTNPSRWRRWLERIRLAVIDRLTHMGGPDMAPQTPQRSAGPGTAGALLET